ncbi:MAG: hypothetical protein KIS78_16165 [Labilithrix sp.]|nr:hypothetical protein [Labilithrix sp.]
MRGKDAKQSSMLCLMSPEGNAAGCGESELATTIADAMHNLPHLLSTGDQTGRSVREFREHFIMGRLAKRFPDVFAHVAEPLLALDRETR